MEHFLMCLYFRPSSRLKFAEERRELFFLIECNYNGVKFEKHSPLSPFSSISQMMLEMLTHYSN